MDIEKLTLELASPDEQVRREAVLTLTELDDPRLAHLLRKATSDSSPAVRFFARRALDRYARREAEGPPAESGWGKALAEAAGDRISTTAWRQMLSDVNPERRLQAVISTHQVQDPAILPLLWDRLRPEPDPRVRASLVKAIGRFRRKDGFDLLALLTQDQDPRVRANAVEALDLLADPRVEPLLGPLLSDPDNRIRGNALKAMSRFNRPRALAGTHEMAASPDVWMRATAIWLYRELGGEQARAALERMLHRETGEMAEKIHAAMDAIEKKRLEQGPVPELAFDPEQLPLIRERLEDKDWNVRLEGVYQAAELPRGKAIPLLKVALLAETHPHVLATLVKVLGQTGSEADAAMISEFLTHPDPRVRANAIEGLEATGSPQAFELAEPLLSDPNQRVRANAAWLIHGQDPAQAFTTLKEMLLSKDAAVQDSALFALREIGSEQVLEVLETGLASANPEVQIKILRVLETWGQRNPLAAKVYETYKELGQAIPWVSDRLDEVLDRVNRGDAHERLRALETLSTFRDPRARQRLSGAMRDPDVRVARRARELSEHSQFDESRRQADFRLGLAAYQWIRDTRAAVPSELSGIVARARQASDELDGGRDVLSSLSLRRQSLVELGREVYLLVSTGQLSAPPLDASVQEIARMELRQQSHGVPQLALAEVTPMRLWGKLLGGIVAGVLLGAGAYFLFRMPEQRNLRPLTLRLPQAGPLTPTASSTAATPMTTSTTAPAAAMATTGTTR